MKEIGMIYGQDVTVSTILLLYAIGFTFNVNDGKISDVSYFGKEVC